MIAKTALTLRLTRAGLGRFLLLSLLFAVSVIVFVVVSELSRASSDGLDQAISSEVGTGAHRIDVADVGLDVVEIAPRVRDAVDPAGTSSRIVETLPAVRPECPPFDNLGEVNLLVIRDSSGRPVDLPFGRNIPFDTRVCFGGMVLPREAIYVPAGVESQAWGPGIAIAPAYRHVALLATTGEVQHTFLVSTAGGVDRSEQLQRLVEAEFREQALRHGVSPDDVVFVQRDSLGDEIRASSRGIRVVYGVIGWGVLLLGALGLLVAELVVVRDRMWLYGLARAMGATAGEIASLVVLDILLVLAVGTVLALGAAAVLNPAVGSFAATAFQVDVSLLRPSTLGTLAVGEVIVLLVAAGVPARRAITLDPLDVLEPKV